MYIILHPSGSLKFKDGSLLWTLARSTGSTNWSGWENVSEKHTISLNRVNIDVYLQLYLLLQFGDFDQLCISPP